MTGGDFSHFQSLIIISGLTGAGKSTAIQCLGDNGYYIVNNLPVPLLGSFFELTRHQPDKFARTALLLDIESSQKVEQLMTILKPLRQEISTFQLLFLDAKTDAVIKRYSETRRPHPSFNPPQDMSLSETVSRERSRLMPIKEFADIVIETSELTVHDLRREIERFLKTLQIAGTRRVRLNFVSFGFKHGIPIDCDMVADVRFLPNPHFVTELKEKTGLEDPVSTFVLSSPISQEFLTRYGSLIDFLTPRFVEEGKTYINIGIGCTGGRHRSVAIAEALLRKVASDNILISVKHRDIQRN